ncbi:MAG TPA: lipoprotein [Bradyrhizobium sp.]|nr:lipoprotein [Bradyrhizobium sp.]
MNRISSPVSSRWALILLAAATLALAGCGRKGPLDLPPNASTPALAAAQTDTEAQREASKPSVFNPSYGADAPPTAPRGTKKPFILDPILNSN